MIDVTRPLKLQEIGIDLPKIPPTQVVSIRLPSALLNELKAYASARDVPYQALIKLLLAESLERRRTAGAV
jgi:predicted DNA binding CopG/RHH family protein